MSDEITLRDFQSYYPYAPTALAQVSRAYSHVMLLQGESEMTAEFLVEGRKPL